MHALHGGEDAHVVVPEVAGSDNCGGQIGVGHDAQDNTAAARVQFPGGLNREKERPMLDVKKLLIDVFDPQPGEVVTFAVDLPRDDVPDHEGWSRDGRWPNGGVARWSSSHPSATSTCVRSSASKPQVPTTPISLPRGDSVTKMWISSEALKASTLVIAMTEFSATAPLVKLSEAEDDFRAASMPGVEERMEGTALAADYSKVAARCKAIYDIMDGAILCDVLFSTGHRCWFDLRHRMPEMDDGFLPRGKEGDRIINLPSGETYSVPYEGEFEAVPSWTSGTIPVVRDREGRVRRPRATHPLLVRPASPGRSPDCGRAPARWGVPRRPRVPASPPRVGPTPPRRLRSLRRQFVSVFRSHGSRFSHNREAANARSGNAPRSSLTSPSISSTSASSSNR